jgi:hypothetical protein
VSHREAVLRDRLELAEGRRVPIARPDDHRRHPGLTLLLPLQRALHLPAPDELRGDEVVAYQEEDEVGALQLLLDALLPAVAGEELAVGLGVDETLALKQLERLLKT